MLGVDPLGRRELISAGDGRTLWHGAKNQDVLAVDDGFAVIRSADGKTLTGRSFSGNGTVWRRAVSAGSSAAVTPYAVIVAGTKPSRITALSRFGSSVLLDLRTGARVFAVGPRGLIVVDGRDMAYLPFR
jgi:outer membrane protein assembly factor BamB